MAKKNPSFKTKGKLGKPNIGKESNSIRLTIPESGKFSYEEARKFLLKSRLALTIREGDPDAPNLPGIEHEQVNVEADCQEFTTTETGFGVTLNFGQGLDDHKLLDFKFKDVYVIAEKIGDAPKAEETAA
jgi:hypothetical protein